MTEKISRTLQISSVFRGMFGGAIVKGCVVGERTQLHCNIDSRIMIEPPRPGEFWKMAGELYDDAVHGQQLRVSACEQVKLPEHKYVASLLVNHPAFKGFYFGQKKVAALLELFGSERLVKHLNDGNVYELSRAIQPAIAIEVVKAWQSLDNEVDTINFLLSHRFSPQLARKVISLCRDHVVERLKKNPYALVCFGDISRSIWRTVEACAAKLGKPLDDENRLIGSVEHVLYESLRQGHTAMPLSELIERVERLLKSKALAERAVLLAVKRRFACVLNRQPDHLIQLYGPATIEMQLEKRIEGLLSGPKQMRLFTNDDAALERLIDEYCSREAEAGLEFTPRQKSAIFMALTSRISVLSGFGGTGKTTVLRAIIDIAKLTRRETHLLALAGKAKERARQATGHRAFTIHAFLAAVEKGAEDIKLDDNPLIIIDEASMVDAALFNQLLSVIDGKLFSLLTVGDTEQISPVGFGLVWHRLAVMSEIPSVHLTEVHRQRSALHDVAMAVRGGVGTEAGLRISEWKGEDEGVYYVPATANGLRQRLLLLKSLERDGKLPECQILTPHITERMPDSGARSNQYLQQELNGGNPEIRLGSHLLLAGDPVIVSENNYDLGLFNGTTGRFVKVTTKDDMLAGVFTLEGQPEEVTLSIDDLYDVGMKPAYAVSIHKSQGSEYDATIITCIQDSTMLERSLIYTALTRAKKLCLVVGSLDVFHRAVRKPSRAETLCVGFFLSRLHPGGSKPM